MRTFLVCLFASVAFQLHAAKHVVLIVWDGMRPDFVTASNCPNLFQLSKEGVTFTKHHSAYPSATEVNGTVIATGVNPARSHIVGNHEYRPYIDELADVHTEALASIRKGDEFHKGDYIAVPTLAEAVRASGGTAVVAGSKPIALLLDRKRRDSVKEGVNVYYGATLPESLGAHLTNELGNFPEDEGTPSRIDWTVDAMVKDLWSNTVPTFSFVWMNQPDLAQHKYSPGSPEALASIGNADQNLGRILAELDKKGVRDATDVFVVSDHGCSTITANADLAGDLSKAGFHAARKYSAKPKDGDIIVASNSGSTMVYVIGHDQKIVTAVVAFLQRWKYAGVIFTRDNIPATFPLKLVHLDAPEAPDIVISLRWDRGTNRFGTVGTVVTDGTAYKPGQGAHVTLSQFDMHNTLIAAGPDFRAGVKSELPSGNLDVAPTVLHVLGIQPKQKLDGRVLDEALKNSLPESLLVPQTRSRKILMKHWEQYLSITEFKGVQYFDEGNGRQK
ncbi:MAG: Type phosphodiesterase/nucleotide pyrophosphatase [Verrucomicrobiales bacterium]|nr:Type phosphodiesterase/nucleotide pyrophosphatase [Verrucomicrobiales bacterium]